MAIHLPVLAVIFAAKAGVTGYLAYKNRDKLPKGHWRDAAHKDLKSGSDKQVAPDADENASTPSEP